MGRIGEKLKCRRGASILLALLFLLVSVLVAMSVLMAAASNAGKIRSNREEQQKYFTLSSALNLVIAELTSTDTYYQGKYWIKEEEKERDKLDASGNPIPELGPDGNPIDPPKYVRETYFEYSGGQQPGEFQCGLNGSVSNVLPLADRLDETVFQNKYRLPTPKEPFIWLPEFKLCATTPPHPDTYQLELTLNAGAITDSPWLAKKVLIDVNLKESGDIVLTAKLDGDEYISMEARLRAVMETSNAFDLVVTENGMTGKVTWELERIEKKEATTP